MSPAKVVLSICLLATLALFGAGPATQHQEARFRIWVESPMQRIHPDSPPRGKTAADLYAARNETEGFQVGVSSSGARVEGMTATISDLEDGHGNRIERKAISLYRPEFVYIRKPSPYSSSPPAWWPDPLVPCADPFGSLLPGNHLGSRRSEESALRRAGPRFPGMPFDLWPGRNQSLWVEITVPKDTPAGNYTGKLTFWVGNQESMSVPIRLVVWNFSLPDGPALAGHFGTFEGVATKHELTPGSVASMEVETRYVEELSRHRLDPPIPSFLRPPVRADGNVEWKKVHERLKQYVASHHVRSIEIPAAPFADPLRAHRKQTLRYLRGYYDYLKANGWEKGAYYFPINEPNSQESYEWVREYARLVHEANPHIRFLCTEQPYPQDPVWGDLRGSVDIWCPLFAYYDQESADAVRALGNQVWVYNALCQKAPPFHPNFPQVGGHPSLFWQIDFPVLNFRIPMWLVWRNRIQGLLYWSTVNWDNPARDVWTDPAYRNRYNGEGFLLYPGLDAGIEGPVPSIRLKALRDGMEDYLYFELLASMGESEFVRSQTSAIASSWWKWEENPEELAKVRMAIARRILEKQAGLQ
ncbi:MAG: glycoside hydrolase domain-containing protein [Acidobacteriota bacterium]